MWFVFAMVAGILYTAEGLIIRHVMRAKKDAWAFSFYFSAVGAAVSLPFMLIDPQIPRTVMTWVLAVVAGLVLVAHNLLLFLSSKHLEPSIGGAISKVRLVWVFLLSVVLLAEPWSWVKLAGTVLACAAGIVVIRHIKWPDSAAGIGYALGSTVF